MLPFRDEHNSTLVNLSSSPALGSAGELEDGGVKTNEKEDGCVVKTDEKKDNVIVEGEKEAGDIKKGKKKDNGKAKGEKDGGDFFFLNGKTPLIEGGTDMIINAYQKSLELITPSAPARLSKLLAKF